ncbi:MAG: succinate dehydrogenase, hydrophobic membrane anchor protein [Hyphomicrobiales bacterium]|nr:succinate dehydrogenase, hydrophobic membrane anchor protein [Hyphomicrobiales bacterium]
MANNSSSMRTDVSKVRFLGSARNGTHHAWAMRVTSLALALLTIGFVFLVMTLVGRSYEDVVDIFGSYIWPGVVALLFTLVGCYHMKLGMQTIIEDYVHGEQTKLYLLMANTFICGLIAAAAGLAIIRLSLG